MFELGFDYNQYRGIYHLCSPVPGIAPQCSKIDSDICNDRYAVNALAVIQPMLCPRCVECSCCSAGNMTATYPACCCRGAAYWNIVVHRCSRYKRYPNPRPVPIPYVIHAEEADEQSFLFYPQISQRPSMSAENEKKNLLSILLLKNLHSTTAYPTKQTAFPITTCVPNPHQKNPK